MHTLRIYFMLKSLQKNLWYGQEIDSILCQFHDFVSNYNILPARFCNLKVKNREEKLLFPYHANFHICMLILDVQYTVKN